MDLRHARVFLAACAAAWLPGIAAAQSPPPLFVFLQEFFNPDIQHYQLTLSDFYAPSLPGDWQSTSYGFIEFAPSTTDPSAANAVPVCQFDLGSPMVSRLYTADAAECEFLKSHDTGWAYKGIAFKAVMPTNGVCPASYSPVYRMYDNRAAARDSNHRFNWDDRLIAKMQAQGWILEGIAFCGRFAQRDFVSFEVLLGSSPPPSTSCGFGVEGQKCIALTALRDMPERVWSRPPPGFSAPDPLYTPDFAAKTGWIANIDLVFSTSFAGAPAQRSFVEWVPGGQVIGVHLVGSERRYGNYATISPTFHYGEGTTIRTPVAPWPDRGAHDVIVNFQLKIATVWRTDDASQAYGGPVIEFLDTKSGEHLLLRVLAYGSQPPGDFTGVDPVTGLTMVSTSWASPRFGRVLKGAFIACPFATLPTGCAASGIDYSFRIDQDDFAAALALARSVNPALSADIADYVVANAQLRNETRGDAELGLLENALQFTVTK